MSKDVKKNNKIKDKKCTQCGVLYPETTEYFYMRNKKKPEKGFNSECKECTKKNNVNWTKNNKDKKKIYDKRHDSKPERKEHFRLNRLRQKENGYRDNYVKNNPEKFKQYAKNHRNHDITTSEWIANKNFFKNKNNEWCCAYCGITEKEHKRKWNQQLHKDHVVHDGYNDIRNCIPSCKQCNSQKSQEDMEEWFRKQSFFTDEKLQKILQWTTEEYKNYIEEKPPYRIKRSRIYKDDNTYCLQHELWSVDEKRNFIKCITTGKKKKDLNVYIVQFYNEFRK